MIRSRKVYVLPVLLGIAAAVVGGSVLSLGSFQTGNQDGQFLCMVENGQVVVVDPCFSPLGVVRLTSIPMYAAQPPVSGELDLTKYEGSAIMVSGFDGGGWIYSAEVVDHAGPILTAVVRRLFQSGGIGDEME